MKPSIRVIDWGWVFMAIVWALACLSGLAFIAYNSKDNPAHRCQCECPAPPAKPARIMTGIAELEALLRKFEEALNEEIENEMRRVITYSGHLTCILKCMGIVCFYDRNGPLPDPPVSARRLLQLEDMDRTFYSLTGHPLKIIRNPDGSFTEVRDW